MDSNWKQIVQKGAVVRLQKHSSPLLVKELAWRAVVFVAQCGRSNPVSFALRPLAGHKRLKTGLGVMLVVLAIIGAGVTPLPSRASNSGGGWEVAMLGEGEVRLVTQEAVVDPLPLIEMSQKYWFLHPALDMRALAGTPIKPIMAGRVIAVETERWGYGKHVIIDHGNGYQSLYAHMAKMKVEVGQEVDTGSVIGEVGSTGRSTGPHLHLEVRENGKTVNPAQFLDVN